MNLLSKVTRGPWDGDGLYITTRMVPFVGPTVEVVGGQSGDVAYMADAMEKDEKEANKQLLAASYDHALLLAAVTGGVPQEWWEERVEPNNKDPFGCPVLTDELRGELERLLGLFSGETAGKAPETTNGPDHSEPQVVVP